MGIAGFHHSLEGERNRVQEATLLWEGTRDPRASGVVVGVPLYQPVPKYFSILKTRIAELMQATEILPWLVRPF